MTYNIGNIKFNNDIVYDKVLYWSLFRIYSALNDSTDSLAFASSVACNTGVFLYNDIIKEEDKCEELYEFLFYKTLLIVYSEFNADNNINKDSIKLAKSISELKRIFDFNNINKNEIDIINNLINRYNNRINNFIPKEILGNIQDDKFFLLGYIDENINNQLVSFKNKLKKWLIHPNNTNLYYELDDKEIDLNISFHDQEFIIKKTDNKLELIGEEHILFNNCLTVVLDCDHNVIVDDNKQVQDYSYENVEGYSWTGINHKNNNKKEFILELSSNKISSIIVETDEIIIKK